MPRVSCRGSRTPWRSSTKTHGFKSFDQRDLLGFVDGTENPTDQGAIDAAIVGDEDAPFSGGSYVIVQKYLHDLTAWNARSTEDQERIVGREKLSDIELDDAAKPSFAHNVLTSITDNNGNDLDIVRDNMPFGSIGAREYGTYFIGYAREPARTERMLTNMFIGNPPGNYDRILDFSRAVTGSLFFVPSATFLENVTPAAPDLPAPSAAAKSRDAAPTPKPSSDGSLNIGSLKLRGTT